MLNFEVMGTKQLARGFSRFTEDVKDLSEAFREIVMDFHEGEERQFATQGNYGAGGWKPLAPSTLERKARGGYPTSILVRTGDLADSLTGMGGNSIAVVRPLELRLGTKLKYAKYHQKGRGVPARPVIMLPEEQKRRWTKYVQVYLVKQIRARGLS